MREGVVAEVLVVNAAHIKQVPGRKTAVKDAEWIADLLRHGLLRASFSPDRPPRELRDLTRYRTALVRARTREVSRRQKVLEGGHSKLAAVATDIRGVSGRAILAALRAGQADAATRADLARGKLRAKIPQRAQALVGRMAPHQRFMIAAQVAHLDALDESLARVSAAVAARLAPFAAAVALLDTSTGIGVRIAEALLAAVGADMTRFPRADHLTSGAGLSPGSNERAGKRRAGKTRKGAPWLRSLLIEAAQAAGRAKDPYLGARYQRLAARIGKKRAAVAVARTILIIIYHMRTTHQPYRELGATYLQQRDRQATERRLVRRLEALGYDVALQPKEPAA